LLQQNLDRFMRLEAAIEQSKGNALCHLRRPRPATAGFLRFAHAYPALLRLPGVDRVLRHAHFSRHVVRLAPRFQLFSAAIICASACLLLDMLLLPLSEI
jgi:hypothetical protein